MKDNHIEQIQALQNLTDKYEFLDYSFFQMSRNHSKTRKELEDINKDLKFFKEGTIREMDLINDAQRRMKRYFISEIKV